MPGPAPHTDAGVWSAAVRGVWGKISVDPPRWLPLVQHLEDAAGVGGVLFDEWLAPSQRDRIIGVVGSRESARALTSFLCGVHDIGKCSPAFVYKARAVPGFDFLHRQMLDAGFTFPVSPGERLSPHGVVGQVIVSEFMKERASSRHERRNVADYAQIVGGHHGRNPTDHAVQSVPRAHRGGDAWITAQREIWDGMIRRSGAEGYLAQWLAVHLPTTVQMTLSAVVIVADWMSSNTDLFPYDEADTPTRLARGLSMITLPESWRPEVPTDPAGELLASRFPRLRGRTVHPIQQGIVEACRAMTEPSMVIVEAPMGCGKTEGALLGAELLAARFGASGVFVGLPTMATSNPMFTRVHAWLQHLGHRTTLNLVHGKAALNEEFSALVRGSRMNGIADDDGQSAVPAAVTAASWFSGRKRAALATHVVGTVDQALFAGLKAKHVVLRHLALDGKVVVIDEVHAADDFMRVYLCCVLRWLGAYRTPVILMSATLPPAQRLELAQAYASGWSGRTVTFPPVDDAVYPRLSVVARELSGHPVTQPTRHRPVRIRPHPGEVDAIVTTVTESLAGGGCAAVVCNTVARAQEVYAALRPSLGADVRLLHSKFVAPHRAQRERSLVAELGPGSEERPARLVVVGTQVLEQSLDIDVDVMITDLAPTDLVLQRIGRLHRHPRGDGESERPTALREPVCWVAGWSESGPVAPDLDRGSVAVYGAAALLRTAAVLAGVRAIGLPGSVPHLVARAYDPGLPCPPGWEAEWQAAAVRAERHHHDQSHRAAAFVLGSPITDSGLAGLIDHEASDPDAPQAVAQVRDSEESLEVIVIHRGDDGQYRLIEGVGEHAGRLIPTTLTDRDRDLARAVATCTVTLPGRLTRAPRDFEQTVAALERDVDASAWQQSSWLAGQLFLALDHRGVARVGDHAVAYDPDIGLRVLQDDR